VEAKQKLYKIISTHDAWGKQRAQCYTVTSTHRFYKPKSLCV